MRKPKLYQRCIINRQKVLILGLLILLVLPVPILAQAGNPYDLTWYTIDNGGGESSGGNYTVVGTIGQPEAGVMMSSERYSLSSGFWEMEAGASTPITGSPTIIKPVDQVDGPAPKEVDGDYWLYLPVVVKS